jgi:hypothetical protein
MKSLLDIPHHVSAVNAEKVGITYLKGGIK